jgi:hypothetical protein
MVTLVIGLNALIAIVCLFVASQIWRFGRKVSKIADRLAVIERKTHNVLHPAPGAITRGQVGIYYLRQDLKGLDPQLQRMRKLLELLGFAVSIMQGRSLFQTRSKFLKKSASLKR